MPAFNQIGYVVDDVDEAMRYWVDVIGVAPFFVYRNFTLAECIHEGDRIELTLSVAYAQAGEVQVELIQPLGDGPSPYRGWASGDTHHVAVWTTSYDRDVETYRSRGLVAQTWGTASGKPDERFTYLLPSGPGPMLEVVEVPAAKVAMYRRIADAARSYDGTEPLRETSLSSS